MNITIAIVSILCFNGSTMQTNEENQGILQEDWGNRRESVEAQDHSGTAAEDAGWTPRRPPTDPRFQDLTGEVFGRLTVIGFAGSKGQTKQWMCLCSCGSRIIVNAGHMKNGHTKSCGCISLEARTPDELIPPPPTGLRHLALTKGKYTVVEEGDYASLSEFLWYYDGRGYASRSTAEKEVKMHRFIMGEPEGFEVDHENRNKLDNRRSNLRIATSSQNGQNKGISSRNTSGFKGASLTRSGKWLAQIKCNGVHYGLGLHETPELAHAAYCAASIKLHGEFSRTA